MLVWLAEHLVKYYSGFNVFSYLTFRAIVSLLTALFISLWMGPRMIAHLQKLSFGQVVRNDGPESHFSKRGTPTMGGIMILTAIVISVLLWAYPSNPYVWCVLVVLVGYGVIGFVDDYRKVVRKDTKGLIARWSISGCRSLRWVSPSPCTLPAKTRPQRSWWSHSLKM